MVQVGGVSYLVEAFPFLFSAPLAPTVIRKELLLVHQGGRYVNYAESCLHGTKAVIGVVAKNEQVWQPG